MIKKSLERPKPFHNKKDSVKPQSVLQQMLTNRGGTSLRVDSMISLKRFFHINYHYGNDNKNVLNIVTESK